MRGQDSRSNGRSAKLVGVAQAEEQRVVQKLVAHAAVEAFAKGVLHRLAWGDVMAGDGVLVSSALRRFASDTSRVKTDPCPVNKKSALWRAPHLAILFQLYLGTHSTM